MRDAILAIDQGTTGTTALLMDRNVQVIAQHNVEFPNYYPRPGWVEHDADEIWGSVGTAVKAALEKAGPVNILAIGITNQRETSVFWDRKTGQPAHRALVWQDRRTADVCQRMKDEGLEALFKARTGLVLDPYFSGTKAQWMLNNVDGLRGRAEAGDLAFGTIDSYLVWRLCGEHLTDPSNASRTLLFDIHELEWGGELLDHLSVPQACLPKVVDNAGVMGHTRNVGFLPDGIPIGGMAGDQQSALFGQACFEPGMAKSTYGTGAFVLMNTGNQPRKSEHGLLTTVAWQLNGEVSYALEGSAFVAGAAVQWLRDQLGFFENAAEIEALAASVPDSGGVVFVPALAGLGAPHWRPDARGLLCGLTQGSSRAHIARAVLEGIALQITDILSAMSADAGQALAELRVDGGAARNDLLMQFQADMLDVDCVRPTVLETTALGAAFLGGLGAGVWSSVDAISDAWVEQKRFHPDVSAEVRREHLTRWNHAVEKA